MSVIFWTTKTSLPTPARDQLGGASIGSNLGYALCGDDGSALQDNDEYSQLNDSWDNKTSAPAPARNGLAASTIGTDKCYIYGGFDSPNRLQDNDEYSQTGNSWANNTSMPAPGRIQLAASTINSDTAYVYGGIDTISRILDCDEYDQTGDNWTNKTDMSAPARSRLAASTIGTDKAYIYAGDDGSAIQDCDEYSQIGNSWANKTSLPNPVRQELAASSIGSETSYVFGGDNSGVIADADEYNQTGDSWTSKTDMPTARSFLAGFTIGDYRAYAIAGNDGTITQDNEELAVVFNEFDDLVVSIDNVEFIDLKPSYATRMEENKPSKTFRTRSGKLHIYKTNSAFYKFNFPLTLVSSFNTSLINSWWESKSTIKVYFKQADFPNSGHNTQAINKEQPLNQYENPFFQDKYRGTLQLETSV